MNSSSAAGDGDVEMSDNTMAYLEKVKESVRTTLLEKNKILLEKEWSVFVREVVIILREKGEEDYVVATATGLIVYGATTEEKLKNIAPDNKKEFRDTLTAKGVPDAICDLLFEKYVANRKVGWPPLANKTGSLSTSHIDKKRVASSMSSTDSEFGIFKGVRVRHNYQHLWDDFENLSRGEGLPNGSENEIQMHVTSALNQILYEVDVTNVLNVRTELQVAGSKSDCWIIDRNSGYPICAVEVKKPSETVLENEYVNGQVFDYMRTVQSFYGVQHVFGVISTYKEWKICWFPESNKFAQATTEEDTKKSLKAPIVSNDKRTLCGTRILKHSDNALLDFLGTMMKKIVLANFTKIATKRFDDKRHYMAVVQNSFSWHTKLEITEEMARYDDFKNVNITKLFLLEVATMFPTAEGRAYIACDVNGRVCAVKLREKSSSTKLYNAHDRLRFSTGRKNLAKQEFNIWKEVYGKDSAKLCTLNNRDALVMPYVEPLSCTAILSQQSKVLAVLERISQVKFDKGFKQFDDGSVEETKGGFVEHADLKLSHFGIYTGDIIIFDFGIVNFHATQQTAFEAMKKNFDLILDSCRNGNK